MPGSGEDKTFIFLEPFCGGSHQDFAEGLVHHSDHRIRLYSLPARFWKWRMRGAALHFAGKLPHLTNTDGLIVSDMMSLSDFKSLYISDFPPSIAYFHENQLTYPTAHEDPRDLHFGFTNITTALAADRILFNSSFQFNSFFESLPELLKLMPDYPPLWVEDQIKIKSGVCHPGCRFPADPPELFHYPDRPLLIIWNHRWEFDKNPKAFFNALDAIERKGIDFKIALLGENFENIPEEFANARSRFGRKIVQYGYIASRQDYLDWLSKGSIVISTALQENFGISVIEAIRFGCFPLLPDRLSYPEIIPRQFHDDVLYADQQDLILRLSNLITTYPTRLSKRKALSEAMGIFSWQHRIKDFNRELNQLTKYKKYST